MKCEEAQLMILENQVSDRLSSHLAECPDCRQFQQDTESLMNNLTPAEPSAALDKAILDFAHSQQTAPVKRFPLWLTAVTAAAACLVAALLLSGPAETPAPNPGTEVIATTGNNTNNGESTTTNTDPVAAPDWDGSLVWEDNAFEQEVAQLENDLYYMDADIEMARLIDGE